jgi:hypothetical protein
METFYDLQIRSELQQVVQRDIGNLLKNIKTYQDVSAQNIISRYITFAANMHRAKVFNKKKTNSGESHLIHWMANLREGSSTTEAVKRQLTGFIYSMDDICFMTSLCNVMAVNPCIYLMDCKNNVIMSSTEVTW